MNLEKQYGRELIYDGLEITLDELSSKTLRVQQETIQILPKGTLNEFSHLLRLLSPAEIESIISECELNLSSLLNIHKSRENLKCYYSIAKTAQTNYLVVISFGELQPSRYKLFVEGIWRT